MLVLLRLLNSPPTRKEFISSQNFKTTEPLQDNETQVNFRTDYSIHKAIRYPPQHHDSSSSSNLAGESCSTG